MVKCNFYTLVDSCVYLYHCYPKQIIGGVDKNVVAFDRTEDKIVATLKGHSKKVNRVIYHPKEVLLYIDYRR